SARRGSTTPRRQRKRTTPRSTTAAFGWANVKLQPDSAGAPRAVSSLRQPESAPTTSRHAPDDVRYWTRKRIDSFAPRGVPGIEALIPIASGCFAVSQTLTVAHRGASAAADTGATASTTRAASSARGMFGAHGSAATEILV